MFSRNLRYYRLAKGMTKKALAQACGVTPMAITNYENGDRRPGMDTLKSLVAALGIGLADLLRDRGGDLHFQHGEFRKHSRLSAGAQELVRESVEEHFSRFYSVVDLLGGDVLPKAPAAHAIALSDDAEIDAANLRAHLGIAKTGPVPDLVKILENEGILVMGLDIGDDGFSGMNGFVEGRPYIVVNASMSPERNRSTIVHELAHLMFEWLSDMSEREAESRATAIGGAFLLPRADAIRELGYRRRAITGDMALVCREYGISMMMLAKRAQLCGIVGDAAYKNFCIATSKMGWRKDEPSRIESEEPTLFNQLVYRAVSEDDISVQKGSELLGVPFDEVARTCALNGA